MTDSDGGDRLLAETSIVDHYPPGIPPVMSDHLRTVMEESLGAGESGLEVYDRLADERARQFRDDPAFRERVRAVLERSGVDVLAATVICFGMDAPQGWEAVGRAVRRFQTYVDAADWLSKALSPDDLGEDGVSLLLEVQDTVALDGDVARLDALYDMGIRIVQLTYSHRNLVGDGCAERTNAGLSHFGVELVERLDELGVVVDLSHVGPATTRDAFEVSESPAAFTHTFCRELFDHPRGKTDEELERLAAADGYVGVVGVPFFLGDEAGVDALLDHVDHAVGVVGVDRVSVVTNWGVWTPDVPAPLRSSIASELRSHAGRSADSAGSRPTGTPLPPMESYDDWPAIPAALADRGYTDAEVRGLCGGNFVDYFERVV